MEHQKIRFADSQHSEQQLEKQWRPLKFPFLKLLNPSSANSWVETLENCRQPQVDYMRMKLLGNSNIFLITDPDAIHQIFSDQTGLFCRGEPKWTALRRVLGNGLITADGEEHRKNRRVVAKLFKKNVMMYQAEQITETVEQWCRRWQRLEGQSVDIHREMTSLTLTCIGKILFDVDFDGESEFAEIFESLNSLTNRADVALFGLVPWMPVPANRLLQRSVKRVHQFIDDLIDQRQKQPSKRSSGLDALSLLMSEEHGWSREQLRDELITLFAAGHESVAAGLAWVWYLLDQHPDIADQVYKEAVDVGCSVSPYERLGKLSYTRQTIFESMRLYPPVWFNGRKTTQATAINGYALPKGAKVWLLPYLVQRDARWFDNPTKMDPSRFSEQKKSQLSTKAYFPFGGGERKCIGHFFADMEMSLIISSLIKSFRPQFAGKEPPALAAGTTLYPQHGISMTILNNKG